MKAIAARADEGSTQAEERLRLEESLRLVIETTPALVHSALPDGSLDFFNRRWLQYLGRSLEDLQGWGWTGVIHPEDVAGIVDKWRTALATGELFEAEARVRRADGEYRWFLPGARLPRGPCNVACRSELSRILAIPLAGRTSNAACHAKPGERRSNALVTH